MSNKYIKIAIVVIPLLLLILCLYKCNSNNTYNTEVGAQQVYLDNMEGGVNDKHTKNIEDANNIATESHKSNIGGYNIYETETFMDFGKMFGGKNDTKEVPAADVYSNTNKYIGETPPFADLDFNKSNVSVADSKLELQSKLETKVNPTLNTTLNNDVSINMDKNMDIPQMLKMAKELKSKLTENASFNLPRDDVPEIYETHAKISQINTNTKPVVVDPDEKMPKYNIENSCKFFPDDKCPPDYPIFSGASLAISGDSNISINCNGNSKNTTAKAFAYIENGSLTDVIIINKGKGYKKPPKITVIGGKSPDYVNESNNENARLHAEINDDGEVELVNIIHKGKGYTGTPTIIIDPPKGHNECHMCCKKQ